MNIENLYFDTNFYRELVSQKSPIQIKLEVSNLLNRQTHIGISSYIHIYVLFELFAHLSSPSDKSFTDCRNAIIALTYHCKDFSSGKYKFVNDFDTEMINHLFHRDFPESNRTYDVAAELCNYIFNNPDDYYLEKIRENLIIFSKTVEEVEINFVKKYKNFIEHVDPTSSDWQIYKNDNNMKKRNLQILKHDDTLELLAVEEIKHLAKMVDVEISEEQSKAHAKVIIDNFNLLLLIKREIIKRIIETGFDLTKKRRENWFWDMHLAACVFTNDLKGKLPFGFVTSDGGILKIAKTYNIIDRIISNETYFRIIKD